MSALQAIAQKAVDQIEPRADQQRRRMNHPAHDPAAEAAVQTTGAVEQEHQHKRIQDGREKGGIIGKRLGEATGQKAQNTARPAARRAEDPACIG